MEYIQKQQILELNLSRKVEMAMRIATFLVILLSVFEHSATGELFNVRQHLSTVSRSLSFSYSFHSLIHVALYIRKSNTNGVCVLGFGCQNVFLGLYL